MNNDTKNLRRTLEFSVPTIIECLLETFHMKESIATWRHDREITTLDYIVTTFRAISILDIFRFDGHVRSYRGDIVMREKMLSKNYCVGVEHLITQFLNLRRWNVAIQLNLERVPVCVNNKSDEVETELASRHRLIAKARTTSINISQSTRSSTFSRTMIVSMARHQTEVKWNTNLVIKSLSGVDAGNPVT